MKWVSRKIDDYLRKRNWSVTHEDAYSVCYGKSERKYLRVINLSVRDQKIYGFKDGMNRKDSDGHAIAPVDGIEMSIFPLIYLRYIDKIATIRMFGPGEK